MKNVRALPWKKLKYLFLLAPVLIVMGLSAAAVLNSWSTVPIGLMLAGTVILVAWLVLEGYRQRGFWGRRSTQAGTNALLSTLAILAIFGMVNFLGVRYASRLDLTENQIFTLAPQSQEVVQRLQQPAKVWMFTPTPDSIDRELLENYRRRSPQFSYETVDPQAKPGVAHAFNVRSVGEVYLETGGNRRFIQMVTPTEHLSERKVTNAIAQVGDTQPQKVYFLEGHGEKPLTVGEGGLSQATGRLKDESFNPQPLNLAANSAVPPDASVVVVAGAERPLLPNEVDALSAYLEHKGGLLLLIDPQTDPKLDNLLTNWGVRVSDRLVIDPAGQASGLGPGVTIVNRYGDHPITHGFGSGFSFYPLVRPLEVKPVPDTQATPLLYSSDRTTAQLIGANGELKFDAATDPKGPFNLGTALSRSVRPIEVKPKASPSPSVSPSTSPEAASPSSPSPSTSPSPTADPNAQARLVVIGNSGFATDGRFGQQLNGDLFLNTMTWLSQRDSEVLSIRPREVKNRRILLSPEQQISTALIAILLPAIGFGTAALVWWRRR